MPLYRAPAAQWGGRGHGGSSPRAYRRAAEQDRARKARRQRYRSGRRGVASSWRQGRPSLRPKPSTQRRRHPHFVLRVGGAQAARELRLSPLPRNRAGHSPPRPELWTRPSQPQTLHPARFRSPSASAPLGGLAQVPQRDGPARGAPLRSASQAGRASAQSLSATPASFGHLKETGPPACRPPSHHLPLTTPTPSALPQLRAAAAAPAWRHLSLPQSSSHQMPLAWIQPAARGAHGSAPSHRGPVFAGAAGGPAHQEHTHLGLSARFLWVFFPTSEASARPYCQVHSMGDHVLVMELRI